MAIADTSFLIDLGNGKPTAVDLARKMQGNGEGIIVTSISLFEFAAGSPAGIEEKRKKFLEAFDLMEFKREHAEKGGEIYGSLKRQGKDIGAIDSEIAGVALAEKQALITSNAKHFERVPGLQVITY